MPVRTRHWQATHPVGLSMTTAKEEHGSVEESVSSMVVPDNNHSTKRRKVAAKLALPTTGTTAATPLKSKTTKGCHDIPDVGSPSPTTILAPIPVTPESAIAETSPSPEGATTPKAKSPKRKTAITKSKTNKHERLAPKDWQSIYQLVEELRKDKTAPVDTDGSEALPQRHLGPVTYRFQVLIALMLSSQTKDAVVGDAMRKLQAHGLSLENILYSTSYETLNDMIVKVGFHNTKSKNILKVAEILQSNFGGDIPPSAQEMIDHLPGVGPKMAFIVESVAWGKQSGIGVDTHMHRMFNQLQWVNSTQPEQTRIQLESWLPRDYWPNVNVLWVGMGQEVQQFQDKLLRKCLDCSRPMEALKLIKRLGLDYNKVGTKMGWMEEIKAALDAKRTD